MPILEQLPLRRVTLAEALEAMAAFPVRSARVESIAVSDAEGRVLAADVTAAENVPAFRRSRVDGFAVVAADVRGASPQRPVRLRIVGEVLMGHAAPGRLGAGEAMRIPTGGALPEGATGVIMIEDSDVRADSVVIADGSDSEAFITEVASDVRTGETLLLRGTALSPAALGLLSGAGASEVPVFRPPSVGVLVTGDELRAPGEELRTGEIRDINGVVLPAALRAMGFEAVQYGRVGDDREQFEALFRRALAQCDAVVISGGSSVGERDYTPAVVAAAGKPGVIVHGIKAKPGRPALLAVIGDQPVFGLPGNPVSALVVLESLVRPILLRMFGTAAAPIPFRAVLTSDLNVEPDLEHRIPVRLERAGGTIRAEPLLGTSAQMHILGRADGMLVVPLGTGRVSAGSVVEIVPFSRTRWLR
jgi:molybdopterin molybdotransferase